MRAAPRPVHSGTEGRRRRVLDLLRWPHRSGSGFPTTEMLPPAPPADSRCPAPRRSVRSGQRIQSWWRTEKYRLGTVWTPRVTLRLGPLGPHGLPKKPFSHGELDCSGSCPLLVLPGAFLWNVHQDKDFGRRESDFSGKASGGELLEALLDCPLSSCRLGSKMLNPRPGEVLPSQSA